MHVLLVKTSSLGDIVHSLPAVEDAARQGVRFDWVAEEGYAALPRLHRSVGKVIPVAFRRWRKTPVTSLNDLFAFRRRLRLDEYDLVIDAQGLIKSALVGRWARARDYVGFDQASARERWASACYNRRVASRPTGNAIERLRGLFAEAIGYPVPSSEPQFGIAVDVAQEDYCVLLHGTTWDSKHWPDRFWVDLARRACALGLKPKLVWGTEFERQRARRLADAVPEIEVCDAMSLASVVELLARARGVVGVDSGLAHLSAALGRPTVVVFGPTDARLTGCPGTHVANLQGTLACSPCLSDVCRYRGKAVTWQGEKVEPACFASVDPQRVFSELNRLLERD